jgi:PAS domain S-box-containing protein
MGDEISAFDGEVPFVEDPAALQQFVATVPSLIGMLDAEGTVLAHSERWADLFEPDAALDPDDPPAQHSFFDVFPDPDGTWAETFEACLADGETRRGYVRPLTRANGTTHWVDWEVRPWRTNGDVDPEGLLLYLTDRTGQHRAQVTRRQIEQRFDALIDTISEGVLLMDNRGIFRDCNEPAQEILGRPISDIVGTRYDDETWNGLREDGSPMPNGEFPFWRAYVERETVPDEVMGIYPPDAPPRWILVNAQPLFHEGEDEPYAVLICFDDITDEKLKEEALQTSRDLLSSVLSSSLDGITVLSAVRAEDGAITDFECELVNPQAEKMLGTTAEDLIGHRLRRIMPEQEEKGLFDAYCEVVETGEPFEGEVQFQVEGENVWFQVMAVSVDDGVAVTFRDISDRKEAAQAMAAANAKLERRNRALRDFAYIASHDLQEPLRKIRAFSNLVLDDYGEALDETGADYLDRMQDAAERMSQLINDLLVYSRITTQAQPFESVDLTEIAENVRRDLDLQVADVGGTVEIGDLPTVEADPTQIRQLLQNLIGNGLKFHKPETPPHVEVQATVEPASQELQQSGRLAASCTDMCRLTIADNGIGFEENHADRIFSPFKRLHGRDEYEGTGMGLAICRRIVERHGGDITADSAPGEGTTFTVLLPVAREASDPSSESTAQPDLVTSE